jgi:leucine-rich repeat protein SHOC2
MNTMFVWGVIAGALIVGGFFAFNSYIYNEKQGDGIPTEVVVRDDTTLPEQVAQTESLKPSAPPVVSGRTLDLSNQGLTKVPESTFKRTEIQVFDVSNNKLSGSLQAEIRLMKNLVSLDLSDNDFTGVPAEVGQLSKLEYLDLSNNPLTGLPNELGNLSNLKVLDVRGTNYSPQDLDTIKSRLNGTTDILTQ